MAKLGTYYGLCPLIDQRNLLGVSEDVESGNVIVTLGRNIAIKYRFSDQKQIHSWRTKDKFSSPIIYDKESEQYAAIFNQIYIRTWNGDEEHLDKLKKYKFNKPIHTLVAAKDKSYVVYKNGEVTLLSTAIKDRKDTDVAEAPKTSNNILEVTTISLEVETFVGILQEEGDKLHFVWHVFGEDKHERHMMGLSRDNPDLALFGHVLCRLEHEEHVYLLALWSDGRMFSYPLEEKTDLEPQLKPQGNLFAIVESLSCKQPITMTFLNRHYIAMYGAASNEEGATLILYNTQFKVSQARQPLKLFTSGAKLWKVENNLLFCVGQHLAAIPFHLDTEQLAALVGSHRDALNDLDPDITVVEELKCTNWDEMESLKIEDESIPSKIRSKVMELLKQGSSESAICEELLPEYIRNNNVQAIRSCLDYFRDIPEVYVAKLLRFCLTSNAKLFKTTQKGALKDDIPIELQSEERRALLNEILICPFSDVLLLPYIQMELDVSCTLLLLEYICCLMSENSYSLPLANVAEAEKRLVQWGCLLLDANYQKLLLSKDQKIHDVLVCYNKLVENYLGCLESLGQVVHLLREVKRGKIVNKNKYMPNLKYSIEQLALY